MNSFSYLEPVCCSMSSSNCCFLTCIQISQEADQVVWYSMPPVLAGGLFTTFVTWETGFCYSANLFLKKEVNSKHSKILNITFILVVILLSIFFWMFEIVYNWIFFFLNVLIRGFPGGSEGKKICLQCRRLGFDPWVGKIPWIRKWQPTPVFLPGEFHRQGSLGATVHGVTKSWTWLSD